jgi:hypothetical protein
VVPEGWSRNGETPGSTRGSRIGAPGFALKAPPGGFIPNTARRARCESPPGTSCSQSRKPALTSADGRSFRRFCADCWTPALTVLALLWHYPADGCHTASGSQHARRTSDKREVGDELALPERRRLSHHAVGIGGVSQSATGPAGATGSTRVGGREAYRSQSMARSA